MPDVLGERGVVGNAVGQSQRTEVGLERLMVGYFQCRVDALHDDLEVGGLAEVAGVDAGCAERIVGTQGESTSAARTRSCHQYGEVLQRRTEAAMVHECGRSTRQLNIGNVIAVGGEKT